MKRKTPIRAEEIARALREFQANGGMIRKLPDTATPRLAVVGARHGQFENPREQLFAGNGQLSG